MKNDQQQTSLFSFIHPDHACLPRPVRAFCNTIATLMLFTPVFMACISCLGILLGLAGLQEACPALAHGIALGVIDMIKGGAIGFTALLLTAAFFEREQFARFIRDDLYHMIEDEIMPLYR
ncbi:hypothetical protein [Paraburkholderia elongata]|uniref:Uncharacterized protein n=1 Tax=Paraburkholderia elongata TaxID=2675747 RepID=A0A972SFU2_9BURK|nr:hypothetical protein [Paraburkholderia elongata]NPT54208.1 hypothetical protein [Paraburkholderia elongata]